MWHGRLERRSPADRVRDLAARSKGFGPSSIRPNLTDFTSSVTLKDVNPGAERTEALRELTRAKESPWCQTCDWTDEGSALRDLAISQPWTLSNKRVNALLRTLKVHDKNVGEIDKQMKQLVNLEQLVLSANYITWIDGQNLPSSLKVLELHGNFIEDLAGLLLKPPPHLEHLGVGRNNLGFVGDHMSGAYWPCLLSLDLGYNHLQDLKALLESLATLPKLRSLVLAGNPLSLTPWYRGYTVDQLRKLLTLDDTKVSADERHYYKGMVRRKEFVMEQCQIQFKVNTLKNLPIPPEIATPEEFPEYPVIVRKYYVRFWLPFEETEALATPSREAGDQENEDGKGADDSTGIEGKGKLRKSTGFMSDIPEEPAQDDRAATAAAGAAAASGVEGAPSERRQVSGTVCSPFCSSQKTYAELTTPGDSADKIGWEGQSVKSDLRLVRDYLMHSTVMEIVEDKRLLYPPDQLPQEGQQDASKQGQQERKKEEKKDDSKPKKKKKVDESSLVVYSTETTPLVSVSVDVSGLLSTAGQWIQIRLRTLDSGSSPAPTVPSTPANADKRSKDNKTQGKDDKKKDRGRLGSGKPGNVNNSKKPQQQQGADLDSVDEAQPTPPAIEAEVQLQRVQWRSVRDCPTAVVIAVDQN